MKEDAQPSSSKFAIAIALIVIAFTILISLVVLAKGFGAIRTIVVSAETSSMEIEFSGDADYWDLGHVIRCSPLDQPNRTLERGETVCDPRRYAQEIDDVNLAWQSGDRVELSMLHDRTLAIQTQSSSEYPAGTIIYLSGEEMSKIGALSFSGFVEIGQIASSGENKLLASGTYDIREKPFLAKTTETIKMGTFRSGEQISIFEDRKNKRFSSHIYGFVLPSKINSNTFQVSLVSEPGPSKISVGYFGGKTPVEIAPNWIDRSIASPLILSLSILMPILLAITQLGLTASSSLSVSSLSAMFQRFRKAISR